jgi:RHS repeat-associated protein
MEQNFDAWGRNRNTTDWTYNNIAAPTLAWQTRGYTGHEHLPVFGLINMNGRLYDPLLGRMLSPDNYTHGGSQGYNRYTYAMNNPLKYTDPDGQNPFLIGAAVGAAFDIGFQLYSNGWNIHNINWTSVAISAAAGAVGGGIGDALSKSVKLTKALGTIANEAVRSFARGAIIGAFSGAGSSLTSGALHGQRGWELARTVGIGTLTGALLGGAFEYGLYKYQQWRGNVKQPVVLTEEPRINNPRGTASPNTGQSLREGKVFPKVDEMVGEFPDDIYFRPNNIKDAVEEVFYENSIDVYRSVSVGEYQDILKNGIRPGANSYDTGKLFARSYKDALYFGKEFNNSIIVKVRIPSHIGFQRLYGTDGLRFIYNVPTENLPYLKFLTKFVH